MAPCDSSQNVCGGGDTVGTSEQISELLNQIREQDSLHPNCPTGCQSVSAEDAAILGFENLCTYANEYYFIEDNGTKQWSCVGSGYEYDVCPANQLACGAYVEGRPSPGDLSTRADLLKNAYEQ